MQYFFGCWDERQSIGVVLHRIAVEFLHKVVIGVQRRLLLVIIILEVLSIIHKIVILELRVLIDLIIILRVRVLILLEIHGRVSKAWRLVCIVIPLDIKFLSL
jgi:hypothetical protein